jgi:putative transcriptional regulator
MGIPLRIDEMLEERGKSAYWLSKEAGIAETSLHRMKHQKTGGIQWSTLISLCKALDCQPGDLIVLRSRQTKTKIQAAQGLRSGGTIATGTGCE